MNYDIIIIGGGIVGLATAYQILNENPQTTIAIIEKENDIGKHQTGHNSGVIHSGIYYKLGSLRAKNCLEGYTALLHFCDENEIDYDLCGKVIVATRKEELPVLENLLKRGQANNMQGLRLIDQVELKEKEPYCSGIKAIWVPQAGIISYPKVANKYKLIIEQKGAELFFNQKVTGINNINGVTEVITENKSYKAKLIINCAGLYSDKVAKMTRAELDLQILPFRGEYYKIKEEKKYLVKNLIYPVPDPSFPWLGVHFTRMIDGGIEAGPNAVLALKREGYKKTDFDFKEFMEVLTFKGFRKMAVKYWNVGLAEQYRSLSKAAFTKALQRLLPELTQDDLEPGGAGVRALACGVNGQLLDDFVIYDDGYVINVCNAPSPAATSSLAIGKTVANIAIKKMT
jgi:L-2-hydroxyglutarate oxidase